MSSLVCKTENLAEKIEFERQGVAVLKREIFGIDRKPRSKYIREFTAEFQDFEAVATYDELLDAARHARVVYVGDYHALDKYQDFQARLLEDLSDRPLMLGVEMLYGRNQRALDDWMARRISDDQLRRRVRYDLEWGYSWDSYRAILEVARARAIPVFSIDCAPRNDLRCVAKRDAAVARKMADLLERYPDRQLIVSFGESHLASSHLLAKVAQHFPAAELPRQLTILQNIDEIYWKAACMGAEGARVLRVSKHVYCVLNATPFAKYEAYRRQLEIWKAQDQVDQSLDLSSTVYNLINTILAFIRVDSYSYCLTHEGVCIEFVIDAYPEVYSFEEFDIFETILESNELTRTQIRAILRHAQRQGSCYVPRVNAIFIGRFDLVHGAEEAAHFVNFAMKKQRYRDHRRRPLAPSDAFYLLALEEALGYFGSKLIDPRRNQLEESAALHWRRVAPELRRLLGVTERQLSWMRGFIVAHKGMERRYGRMTKVPEIITEGTGSRGRMSALLTHELGYLLGEQLYRAYLTGAFSRAEIGQLFRRRFEEEGPVVSTYLELAERCEPLELA